MSGFDELCIGIILGIVLLIVILVWLATRRFP